MQIVISGASGLVGTALGEQLRDDGHTVVPLVRGSAGPGEIEWDPYAGRLDAARLEGVDAVVHLASAGIGDHRWTDEYKRVLLDSRVIPTRLLATTLAGLERPPAVFASASAIGVYGDRGDEALDESSSLGTGFLADVCKQWEEAARPAADAGIRTVLLRSGIVQTTKGGSLRRQLPFFKLGLGGRFGSGRQWLSWIDLEDEVGAIAHLLRADVEGPVDLTAPTPATNAEFTRALGAAVHRPTVLPAPAFVPKLLFGGELVDNLILGGQQVLPRKLEASGYVFRHPDIRESLRSIVEQRR